MADQRQESSLFRWADELTPAHWQDLTARGRQETAQACGASWDGEAFTLEMLGRAYRVEPIARRVMELDDPGRRLSFQTGLVLISYLSKSTGAPPSGRMVTPVELPGGNMFFQAQGPHSLATGPLVERFGGNPGELIIIARSLGGEAEEAADAAVKVPGLPNIPLWVLLWGGDEEFPARAVIGIDERAPHHLALDGVLALTNLLVNRLVKS